MKKGLTLLLSLVLVLAMSVTAFAAEDWVTPVQNIENWDEEVDFLVVGYGLAGAAAAVEAHDIDPNAKILVLEKMPETLAGGNSIASGQTFLVPAESAVETVTVGIEMSDAYFQRSTERLKAALESEVNQN